MRDRIAIIDINTKKFKAISYKQYDENNILQIVITENGNIVGLSNYSAVVKFQLPSGVVYKVPSIIENNTIKLILTRAILSEHGKVIVEVVLLDTKQLITTFSIYLNVEKSINNEDSQLPEIDTTSDYLHRHENKEVLDQITQEMIDSILEFEELLELDVYATKDYVQSEIEKIDINTDNIDLSNYYTKEEVDEKFEKIDINTDNIDLSNYATKEELPTKVSQLENDLNYLTSIPDEYITNEELNNKGYLTEHQDISGKADKTELFSKDYNDLINKPNIPSLDGYATKNYVKNEIANAQLGGEDVDLSGYATKDELNTKADKTDIPNKLSDLINDSNFISNIPSEYITETELDSKGYLTNHQDISHLATKEEIFSGNYNDLTNKPNIPSLDGYATESYVKNEIANAQLGGEDSNIDLSGYATKDDLSGKADKTDIPTKVSQLENDSNYLTNIPEKYITETELNNKGYLTEHQDLSNYPTKDELSDAIESIDVSEQLEDFATKEFVTNKIEEAELGGEEVDLSGYVSKEELNSKGYLTNIPKEYVTETELNNKGYLTGIPEEYVTNEELNNKGYLTEHQDLSGYISKEELEDKGYLTNIPEEYITESELNAKGYLTEHQDLSGYATKEYVDEAISNIDIGGGGNVNTPPYVTLTSVENNTLGFGEVFNLELDFRSVATGNGTLKVFINDIEVISESIPQGKNTIPITYDNFTKDTNRITLYVIDKTGTMSNSVTLYVDYSGTEIAKYTASDDNTFPSFNAEFKYSYVISQEDGVYAYKILADDMNNLPTSISFNGKSNLLTVKYLNVDNVTSIDSMFHNCSNLTSLDVSDWDTSKVTSMNNVFYSCTDLTNLNVSGWDTSKVTSMYFMFYGCNKLTSLDVSNFKTSNVADMSYMFGDCNRLTNLNVSDWDTSNVTNMYGMFGNCNRLTNLDVSDWDISKVTDMSYMFYNCSSLTSLDSMMNISSSLELNDTILNTSSLLDVIDNLATLTTTKTLTLGTTLLAKLTEEQIAVATNKGWTIV